MPVQPSASINDLQGRDLLLTGAGAVPVSAGVPQWTVGSIPVLDTSAYAAGDALFILPLIEFRNVLAGPSFTATLKALRIDDRTATPQNAAGELWLFDTPLVTLPALNAAWTLVAADRDKVVGIFAFGPYATSTATGVSFRYNIDAPIRSTRQDVNLYGLLVTRGAPTYTASSLKVTIATIRD